jgi:Histone chaperone domain CHZ
MPGGRRTRGVKVDYTSKEALARAGLEDKPEESDEDVEMNE